MREDRFPRAIVIEILRTGLSGGKARSDYDINAMDRAARECGIAGGGSAEVRGVIPHLDERARNRAPDLEAYAAAVEEIVAETACMNIPLGFWIAAEAGLICSFSRAVFTGDL